jgi:hypothetical protein
MGKPQIKSRSDGIEVGVEQIGVGVQRDLGGGVPERPRQRHDVYPRADCDRGAGMTEIVGRDRLHLRPLHRTGEPSAAGLRARQIGAVAKHEVIEAAPSTLHRQFIEYEPGHRHGAVVAALGLADRVIHSELYGVVVNADALRKAGSAIDRVHARVPELLVPGRTEADVAADIVEAIVAEGHSQVAFISVGFGPHGAHPHHSYSDRELQAGDIVVVDIGGAYEPGYHSDSTRTYRIGEPGPDVAQQYSVLQRAQRAAMEAVRLGVTAEQVDAAAVARH